MCTPGLTRLEMTAIGPDLGWCEVPDDRNYNRPVRMPYPASHERMLREVLPGHDAVIFALGVDRRGRTTLFSDATLALVPAMNAAKVRRLIAVTGIGAGETRGHGGFIYDRLIFPLFTRERYADKDLQERIIEASGLDWTIVRPAEGFYDRSTQLFGAFLGELDGFIWS